MMPPRTAGRAQFALIAGVAVAAMMAGFWVATRWSQPDFDPDTLRSIRVLPEPKAISGFHLETADGQAFTRADLEGHWTLMFFGFTNCPDVCPTAMLNLANIEERMPEDTTMPQVIFVSVDPDRDRGEKLDQYAQYFSPSFIGVTGDDAQLLLLTRQLGVVYARQEPEEPGGNYSVDHTAAVLLFDPRARLHAVLPAPHDTERIVAELSRLLRARTAS